MQHPQTVYRWPQKHSLADSDPLASYFDLDPDTPPRVPTTTLPKAMKVTHDSCEEMVDVFPAAGFMRGKKGRGFKMGMIAGWANRGYQKMLVVNEDVKKPSE